MLSAMALSEVHSSRVMWRSCGLPAVRLGAELDAAESFAEGFVAHPLLVLADERADEHGTAAGGQDAAVHVVAPLLVGEIAAHMHGDEGRVQQAQLPDG